MLAGTSHPAYVDYLMSQKFGHDWKQMEARRASEFVDIMIWEAERSQKEAGKAAPSAQKFRPRQ